MIERDDIVSVQQNKLIERMARIAGAECHPASFFRDLHAFRIDFQRIIRLVSGCDPAAGMHDQKSAVICAAHGTGAKCFNDIVSFCLDMSDKLPVGVVFCNVDHRLVFIERILLVAGHEVIVSVPAGMESAVFGKLLPDDLAPDPLKVRRVALRDHDAFCACPHKLQAQPVSVFQRHKMRSGFPCIIASVIMQIEIAAFVTDADDVFLRCLFIGARLLHRHSAGDRKQERCGSGCKQFFHVDASPFGTNM